MEYIVTRWPTCPSMATQQATIKVHVIAGNHMLTCGYFSFYHESCIIGDGYTVFYFDIKDKSGGCIKKTC